MKKFLLVLLAILLAFSLIACDEENREDPNPTSNSVNQESNDNNPSDNELDKEEGDTTSSSQNGNGNVDVEKPGDNEEPDIKEAMGLVLTNAVKAQLEEAASLKLEITLNLTLDADVWDYDEDGEIENIATVGDGIAKFTLTVAKSDYGYNVKIDADVKSREGDEVDYKTDFYGTVCYIVDGIMYEYEEAFDAYLVSYAETIDVAELEMMLAMLIEEIGLTEEQINDALNTIGEMLIEGFGISNNMGSSYVDFKPMLDGLQSYINSIDPEAKTLRELVNDVLSLAGEGITVDILLEGVEEFCEMTLGEYLEYIDAGLMESEGITLQEAYNSIVADENVQMLLASLAYEILGEGATMEDVEAMLEMIVSFNLETDIPAELKSMTMYDIIVTFMYSNSEDEEAVIPTKEEAIATVNAMLDMTLAELELPITQIIDFANMIEINELNTKLSLKFKEIFKIESIISTTFVDLVARVPSEVEGKTDVIAIDMSVEFKLFNISTKVININEPMDKDYIENIFNIEYQLFDEENTLTVTYDEYGEITVSINGEENYTITLDDIDGTVITLGRNIIYLYPDLEYAEVELACDHLWGMWQEDEYGDEFRQCVNCGEIDYYFG